MTISSEQSTQSYSGDGSTVTFPYGYPFFALDEVKVELRATDGTIITPIYNGAGTYDYTVSGTLDAETSRYPNGGSVTFNTAPPSGYTIALFREVTLTQETDYVANDAFPAETHENALDKLTMIAQQLRDDADKSLRFTATETADPTVPPVGANQYLRSNVSGDALAWSDEGPEAGALRDDLADGSADVNVWRWRQDATFVDSDTLTTDTTTTDDAGQYIHQNGRRIRVHAPSSGSYLYGTIVNVGTRGPSGTLDLSLESGSLPDEPLVIWVSLFAASGAQLAEENQVNVFTALQMILFGDPSDTDDQFVIGRAGAPAANNPTMTFKIDNTLPTISTWDGTQNVGLRLAAPIQVGLPTAVPGGAPLGSLNAEHIYVGGRRVNANEPLQVVTPNGWSVVKLGENGEITQTAFDKYVVEIVSLVADTDDVYLIMRTSSDGGATYDSGASDYAAFDIGRDAGSGAIGDNSNSLPEMRLTGTSTFGNAAGESLSATIAVRDPANSSLETMFSWQVDMIAPDTATRGHWGAGRRKQAAAVNAIQFSLSAGNIASATIKLYGVP